jgi:hypothetical protein
MDGNTWVGYIERLRKHPPPRRIFSTAPSGREPDECACTPEHRAWPGKGGNRGEELNVSG